MASLCIWAELPVVADTLFTDGGEAELSAGTGLFGLFALSVELGELSVDSAAHADIRLSVDELGSNSAAVAGLQQGVAYPRKVPAAIA